MEQLFIRLIAAGDDAMRAEWALYEDGQREAGSMADAPLFALSIPAAHGPRTVVLIVPGQQVLLTQAEVTPQQRRHLKKILPFLVEEQLAEDISQMHVVAGAGQNSGCIRVAAVRRAQLESWAGTLAGLKLTPHAVVPESCLLPQAEGRWQLLCDGERFWLNTGAEGQYCMEQALLPAFFALLVQRHGSTALTVDCQLLNGAQQDGTARLLQQLEQKHGTVSLRVRNSDHFLEMLCERYLAGGAALNLLQGEFVTAAAPQPARDSAMARKLARIGLAWAAAMLLATLLQSAYFTWQRSSAQRQMAVLYQSLYPEDSRIVEPVAQMRARLGAPGGESGLLQLLQALAAGWRSGAEDGLELRSLRFDGVSRQLNLEVAAGSIEAVNALAEALQQAGSSAQVVSVSSEADTVRGQLMLRKEAP